MCGTIFSQHKADGFFDYGNVPQKFKALGEHEATEQLLSMRRRPRGEPFKSELIFVDDGPVLPTYLPAGGRCCGLGACALAAADLYEARTGRPQEVKVKQSGSGLMTASYLYATRSPAANGADATWLRPDDGRGRHGQAATQGVRVQRRAVDLPARRVPQAQEGPHRLSRLRVHRRRDGRQMRGVGRGRAGDGHAAEGPVRDEMPHAQGVA